MARMRTMGFLSLFVIALPAYANFADVPDSHPYADGIQYAVSKGIVHGYPDRLFRPEVTLTRAEFVKIVSEAIYTDDDIDTCVSEILLDEEKFPDVGYDLWFGKYVCIAQVAGLVGGYPDGEFKPEERVQLVEAAKVLSLAYGLTRIALPNLGVDNESWYGPYLAMMESVKAIPPTLHGFGQYIKRGEMAEMIFRLEHAAAMETDLLTPHRTLDDLTEQQEWIPYFVDEYGFSFTYPAVWPEPHANPRGTEDGMIPKARSEWSLYLGPEVPCPGPNICVEREISMHVYPSTVGENYLFLLQADEGVTIWAEEEFDTFPLILYDEQGNSCISRHIALFGKDYTVRLSAECGAQVEHLGRQLELLLETITFDEWNQLPQVR